jgi:hypothetical protein
VLILAGALDFGKQSTMRMSGRKQESM